MSLKVTESCNGWGEWILNGHRILELSGWEGPYRSQNHGIVLVGGS